MLIGMKRLTRNGCRNFIGVTVNSARPITVSYVQNGQTLYATNPQGFTSFNGNYNVSENGVSTNNAFYLSDSW